MSQITSKDVNIIISRSLGPDVKVLKYHLEPFSKEKNGILGSHYILSVDVQNASNISNSKTHTFFAKTRPNAKIIRDLIMDENIYFEELHFFKEVYPKLMENYTGERWAPRCYLANEEILVFEDLREQGYSIRPSISLDVESLKSALATLARFHASAILAEKRLGKTLVEAYSNMFSEKVYTNTNKFFECTVVGFNIIATLADRFGLDSGLVPKIYKKMYRLVRATEGGCNVLCHSDLWKNNLMYCDGVTLKCVLVDYQLLRYASPAIDMSMLLHIHTTSEFRKKCEYDLLRYYYSILRETLVQNKIEAEVPTYEDLLADYKERRIVGMAYASMYLPGLNLEPKKLETVMNDPEITASWLYDYDTRYSTILENMEADPVYEKKLKVLISELLEEAKKVGI